MVEWVAYDLTRLFVGPTRATPRGIDRVELGFARHFLSEWPGEAMATLPTPAGVRTISRQNAMRIIATAERCWGEDIDPDNDPLLNQLGRRLRDSGEGLKPIRAHAPSARWVSGLARVLRQAGCVLGPKAHDAVPHNAVYMNVGQFGVAFSGFVGWLQRRPDISAVFMLHDVIPLEHPDFVPASSTHFHRQMVKNVANHASGLITTTSAAASAVRRELQKYRSGAFPILMQALPVSPAFLTRQNAMPHLAQTPYFVVLGSVEPRKNHLLLLNVWRELVRTEGAAAPKLVIAGTRWNGHEPVTAMLTDDPLLNRSVIEISDLSTPSLSRVLANATGVLMPSFAEGFGLPIIEAMALGVPVIASDIAAHREAGGTYATYISPHDVPGWLAAVRAIGTSGGERAVREAPVTWSSYLRRVEQFLEHVRTRQREAANTDLAGQFAA